MVSLVDEIIFVEKMSKILFAIWLQLRGASGQRSYFFGEISEKLFFPRKPYPSIIKWPAAKTFISATY